MPWSSTTSPHSGQKTKTYANSLLQVAEFLSTAAHRPPSVASAMTGGGKLEQRLTMIVSRNAVKPTRFGLGIVLTLAALTLPVGLASAQELGAIERRLGSAVADGEITLEQAQIMLEALKRSVHEKKKPKPSATDRAPEPAKWVSGALRKIGVKPEAMRTASAALKRMIQSMQRPGRDYKPAPKLVATLMNAGLTEAQVKHLMNLARQIHEDQVNTEIQKLEIIKSLAHAHIKDLVASGEITPEDARKRLNALSQKPAAQWELLRNQADLEHLESEREKKRLPNSIGGTNASPSTSWSQGSHANTSESHFKSSSAYSPKYVRKERPSS